MNKQKLSGAFFTPDGLAAALVSWAVRSDDDRMLDPSCGDGRFLAIHQNAIGIEQDPQSAQDAISHAPAALVHEGDFFQWAAGTAERFECAAGNPPFIRYQNFKGAVRQRAFDLCKRNGAEFSGLSSSWAPFLVATASLLKPGGRMAFVVPAEIGHAPYAAPLIEYLAANFSTVRLVAIREKLFPELSEDCWLLYANDFGGKTPNIELAIQDSFVWATRPPAPHRHISLREWRTEWNRRLRPFLIKDDVRSLYAEQKVLSGSRVLSDVASIGIGYVSGDNDFFHLRPSDVTKWEIPTSALLPSARNSRSLSAGRVTKSTVTGWGKADLPYLLLRLSRNAQLPDQVRRYLDSPAGQAARQGYKCRNREPWYCVPDVKFPDFFLSYMCGRMPMLVENIAQVSCSNTLLAVTIKDRALAKKILPGWNSSFSQLSCELEGHPLGGGMLKLEVRESARVRFASSERHFDKHELCALKEGLSEMRRWRHHAE